MISAIVVSFMYIYYAYDCFAKYLFFYYIGHSGAQYTPFLSSGLW